MTRLGLATLNHSPLHGLPIDLEAHLEAAVAAGFDGIAPDIFWLRAIEEATGSLDTLATGLRARGLTCMEIAGIAIGDVDQTHRELDENLRYAESLGAEFVNARIVAPIDEALIDRVRECALAFQSIGTRVALEFSRGSKLNSTSEARSLAEAVGVAGVGVTLDTWHFFLHPDGPEWSALEALPGSLFANVQLSDGVPYGEGEFGQATMDRRRVPGEGSFDLARCAEIVRSKDAEIPIVVEVLNAEERSRPIAEFAERVGRGTRNTFLEA